MEDSSLVCEFCGADEVEYTRELVPDYYQEYFKVSTVVCRCGVCGAINTGDKVWSQTIMRHSGS